jgi:hypothetical protein
VSTQYGTSHFVSKRAANAFYRGYGEDAAGVARKIQAGEIHIGKPAAPAHCPDARIYTDREGRYFIEERAPVATQAAAPIVRPARASMRLEPIPQVDGFDGRKRGAAADWHTGNVSGARSRSINPVEHSAAFCELDDELEAAVSAVHERMARRYLAAMRAMPAPYNTSRHVITIRAGMGACHIDVSGRTVSDWEGPGRGLYVLLEEMAQALQWHWAGHLNGECLNPRGA